MKCMGARKVMSINEIRHVFDAMAMSFSPFQSSANFKSAACFASKRKLGNRLSSSKRWNTAVKIPPHVVKHDT